MPAPLSVIVGAGSGLSASLARQLAARGHDIVLAARDVSKLGGLAASTACKNGKVRRVATSRMSRRCSAVSAGRRKSSSTTRRSACAGRSSI